MIHILTDSCLLCKPHPFGCEDLCCGTPVFAHCHTARFVRDVRVGRLGPRSCARVAKSKKGVWPGEAEENQMWMGINMSHLLHGGLGETARSHEGQRVTANVQPSRSQTRRHRLPAWSPDCRTSKPWKWPEVCRNPWKWPQEPLFF